MYQPMKEIYIGQGGAINPLNFQFIPVITLAMVNRILNPSRVLNISELFYYRHLTPQELFFLHFS